MSVLLYAAVLVATCVETPRDVSLSERGADALEAGDYAAAEQFLGDALEYNFSAMRSNIIPATNSRC